VAPHLPNRLAAKRGGTRFRGHSPQSRCESAGEGNQRYEAIPGGEIESARPQRKHASGSSKSEPDEGGVKLQTRKKSSPVNFWQLIFLLAIAGTALSGCEGNYAGIIPSSWNLPAPSGAGAQSLDPSSSPAQQILAPNFPGFSVPPGLVGGLQRQADCSLTYFDFSYASDAATVSVTPHAQIPHFEKRLHDNAFLGTTPDKFSEGCVDSSRGITSRPFLFLGMGKNGREFLAVVGASGVVTSGLKSDGTYAQPETQATRIAPVSLVSGDLNQDGNRDVVSINSDRVQSSVTVFLGKDDGTYQPGVEYPLPGRNAQYAVLDDLNGDGILDLLVSSDSPAFAFSVFIGNGDGTFQPPQTFAPAAAGLHFNDAFITTDVNGDGIRDIVTASGQVFLGNGDGVSYTPMPQPEFLSSGTATSDFGPSILAADFNNDGRADLATDDGATIRTYLGNGDGTFAAGPAYGTISNSGFLTATDLDGDGNIDLWTGYAGNGMYGGDGRLPNLGYALMGNGDGTFQGTPATESTGASSAVKRKGASATQSLTVSAPLPSTLQVVAGQTSSPFTVNIGSPSGTAQTVTFACSGLPVMSSCMFQPFPLNFVTGETSALETITITTTSNAFSVPAGRALPSSFSVNLQRLAAFSLLALSVVLFRARHRKLGFAVSGVVLLVALASLGGCSNNSSSSTGSGGTPAGTYAVTVTALDNGNAVSTPSTLTLKVTSH
jgi:hypothetical protein